MKHSTNEDRIRLRPNCRNHETADFPNISKPQIIGSFSVDRNRKYEDNNSNLKYLVLPKSERFAFDLNEGHENHQFKPESAHSEKLDHLLTFILKNLNSCKRQQNANNDDQFLKTDFVCFRGLLRLLMCTPYEFREGWSILATRYKGTVYLCAHELEEKRMERLNETDISKKTKVYGFKFEQFILTDRPDTTPDTSTPVIESEEFCCMFDTRLEGINVMYGAEMDGIMSDHVISEENLDLNALELVEVKVKLKERNERQIVNYQRFKVRNWWCQSFLVGVSRVHVGIRSDAGIVERIEDVTLKTMVHLGKRHWSAATCLSFCVKFLKFAQHHTAQLNDPFSVVKFDWNPADRRQDHIQVTTLQGQNPFSFLPDWYTNNLK